jgi:hypothetical protein
VLDPKAEAIAAGATRATPSWPPATAIASFAASYCLLVAAAVLLADMPGAHPIGLQAVLGGAVVSSLGGTLGAAAYRYRGAVDGLLGVVRSLPGPVVGWAGPAAAALAVQLGASAVLLGTMIGLGHARVSALHSALGPGVAGGAVLTLAQVLLVPNLVVWTSAALIGPGFAVGAGTTITLAVSNLGPLPAVPVLGALPADGPLPTAALALLAVPLVAGTVAGGLVRRTDFSGRAAALDVAGASGLAGAAMVALAWLSGGPAGPGLLSVTGPSPLVTGGVFAVEVAAGAALVVAARWTAGALRHNPGTRRARD